MNDLDKQGMLKDGWPEHSIHCVERFGLGPTMLVPVVKREDKGSDGTRRVVRDGRVMTTRGPGVLLQAFTECAVLLDKERKRASRSKGHPGKPQPGLGAFPKAESIHWSEVVPDVGEAARRMRGSMSQRTRTVG